MKYITKLKLAAVHQLCDANDKSTEFMYQFMQDICDVSLETVNAYFLKENHKNLFKEINEFNDLIISLNM